LQSTVAQALAQEPPQPSSAHAIPLLQSGTQGGVMHVPAPSQIVPPFWLQAVPAAFAGLLGTPSAQRSSVHSLPSSGKSVSSATLVVPPDPSHTASWQSPAVCAASGAPDWVKAMPQTPFAQVRIWHSVSLPGQSPAAQQPGQEPPQPSLAPPHLPVQFGVQVVTHVPCWQV
jgi:hypothetical protein